MFCSILTRTMGTLHKHKHIYMTILRLILLKRINFSERIFGQNQEMCFMCKYFLPENSVDHEIMWKNMVQTDRQTRNTRYHNTAYALCLVVR